MNGRIIITGASGSIGEATTRALSEKGYRIIMACRNLKKADATRERILSDIPSADIETRLLELSSLSSVVSFSEDIDGPIYGLFNNAGVISRGYALTANGLENTFAVNYFAPYLLTRLLLPKMEPGGRIVNMVSLVTRFPHISPSSLRPSEKDFSQLGTYSKSKLALLLFSRELSRRYPEIGVNVADPGIVDSNMISMGKWFDPIANVIFRPLCKSPESGARPAVSAMLSGETGRYMVGRKSKPLPSRYGDSSLEKDLWEETGRILSEIIPVEL